MQSWLQDELQTIRDSGLYKDEKIIKTPQGSDVGTSQGEMINFCANNYLGLADSPEIERAVADGLEEHGFGMASVRFICGTQDIHKALERELTDWFGAEDTILYTSCCRRQHRPVRDPARRRRRHNQRRAEPRLHHRRCAPVPRPAQGLQARRHDRPGSPAEGDSVRPVPNDRDRRRWFSMQGDIAPLDQICDLADRYDALVMVDDSHATGFMGPNGLGSPDEMGVMDRIDVLTSTMGKALGGASGGFTTGKAEIVEYLRQRSRPYLFSNTLAPPIVTGALKALEIVRSTPSLRETLWENTRYFRSEMSALGFDIIPGKHPIVPIMLRDEIKTVELAKAVNRRGIFVVGFSFPVVPRGEARIRVQLSAAHTQEQLDRAISVFAEAGRELEVI